MKKTALLLGLIGYFSLGFTFEKELTADEVLQKTNEVLGNIKKISYDSYREINNFKDNYFSKNSGSTYFVYDNELDGKVAKFQLRSDQSLQVYNGSEYFRLDDKEHTYEMETSGVKKLENLSLLYNSITTLRISLPLIQLDRSIPKSVKDTLIDNKTYHLLKFELHKKSISFPSGFNTFDSEVIRYYKVVIDKQTYLPYMIFDGNSISKDQYYTKTIFSNLNLQPHEPSDKSWFYSNYQGYQMKKKPNQRELATVGNVLLDIKLPQYTGGKQDPMVSITGTGKPVLLEFWIKNCGYCMLAFPEMKLLEEKYGKKLAILCINAYEAKEEIGFFYQREKPNYKMLYGGEKFANLLGIYGYPATVLLDGHGKITFINLGFDKEKIEKAIAQL
ncbi:MAG: TlpA disulfide reductase family protein [Pedobacter sp.]|nr:TlpA disulfide reductase family protein [Pedobacter sp.]MDQ8053541.1 TlpA disulfide reductase family protein [Pedobacter sp.]